MASMPVDSPAPHPTQRAPRTFGGFKVTHIAVAVALSTLALWNVWATRQVLELQDRRIVSVSLATLVADFVAAEARNGGTQEQTAARTQAYLSAVQGAVKGLAGEGTTIVVSEAVVGNSVPDVTPVLKRRLDAALGEGAANARR